MYKFLLPSQNSKHVSDHFCLNDLFANQKRALEALKIPLKRELTEAVEGADVAQGRN